MYYNELESMKAAIIEREEQTMNALLWTVESQEEIDELEANRADADYIAALREYLDEGGTFPVWVIPTDDCRYFDFYDNEEDAVNAAYDML